MITNIIKHKNDFDSIFVTDNIFYDIYFLLYDHIKV
jgi:hypothetical protein